MVGPLILNIRDVVLASRVKKRGGLEILVEDGYGTKEVGG